MSYKRIYRSRAEMQLAGLCGGLGEYFQVDPVLIRLLFVLGTLLTGVVPGVVAYLVGWLIVPVEPLPIHSRAREPEPEVNHGA